MSEERTDGRRWMRRAGTVVAFGLNLVGGFMVGLILALAAGAGWKALAWGAITAVLLAAIRVKHPDFLFERDEGW